MEPELVTDVIVIGGGLAGLATAVHLTRGGLKVICLEPRERFAHIVGESLDWSAPQLFSELGLRMEELVATGAATFKKHITITAPDGSQQEYLPGAWLAEKPWNIELRTLHLDRLKIHALMQDVAKRQGVVTLHERAIGFERDGKKILRVQTSSGLLIASRWFVDASGAAASVLGREFNLPSVSYGPRKIALWAHFATEDWAEGTTLYPLSSANEYNEWLWEIPIRPTVTSVGYVAPGSKAKSERASGYSNAEVLAHQMRRFPRLRQMLRRSDTNKIHATSFLCRTYTVVCGPNWIIVGEAASQSDPITGNGVTAALRHAREGSELICRFHGRPTLPAITQFTYSLRVRALGQYFNSLIEKFYYETAVRSLLGLFVIARIYTVPAWLVNAVYSRTRPVGLCGTLVLCSALVAVRGAAWGVYQIGRLMTLITRRHRRGSATHLISSDTTGRGQRNALHAPR